MFYQHLRDLREEKDKSQVQIANLLNTSRQQYARWEAGAWQMPIEHYKTLAKYYNVSLDYLAGLTDTYRSLDGSSSSFDKQYNLSQKGNITNNFS